MRHLDLCSGVGGFALAASWVWPEHEVVCFVELDKYCRDVLRKHWPDAPQHDDIRTYDAKPHAQRIDLLTAGYPCQPFSHAGKRLGDTDPRHLWPDVARIIEECQPRWCLFENVAGHISMGLDQVLSDLETKGYETGTVIIPAVAIDAPHRRDRVWIIANAISDTNGSGCEEQHPAPVAERTRFNPRPSPKGWIPWTPESNLDRVDDGIPDRTHRIKALGNAIVPQVAAEIMYAIKAADCPLNR
jgi:DNA (cytosine-5)-methyltransferase 1